MRELLILAIHSDVLARMLASKLSEKLGQRVGDFDDAQVRHMERTTIKGTPSGYMVDAV